MMTTENIQMSVAVTGSEDGRETYEVRRVWDSKAKKALVLELYPTISTKNQPQNNSTPPFDFIRSPSPLQIQYSNPLPDIRNRQSYHFETIVHFLNIF